jgi:hypothetical protein
MESVAMESVVRREERVRRLREEKKRSMTIIDVGREGRAATCYSCPRLVSTFPL